MSDIRDKLGKELLFIDGALGTELQKRGLIPGEVPESWCISRPQVIYEIHRDYLEAGADIITTNTFGANRIKLEGAYEPKFIAAEAVKLARAAVDACKREAYVALDIGPTGKLLKPYGPLPFLEAYSAFAELIKAGEEAGADLILIETMSDTYEAKAALLAAKECSSLPVFVTMTFDKEGRLLTGGDIASAVTLLQSLGADALGINCGLGPEQMELLLPEVIKWSDIPVIISPNAGIPQIINGEAQYTVEPAFFAAVAQRLIRAGASVLGGCCGTTPEHIREMVAACRKMVPKPIEKKAITSVSSYSRTVVFEHRPIIIGERLNPTGKPLLKEALRRGTMDYIYREALKQEEMGALILDVNVGLPDIDEAETMVKVIEGLQGVVDLPLQIDTSSVKVLEKALRIYNGKPLINSVSGKEESLNSILPLVKKYGACVVALTLDDEGIPATVEDRLAIAEKIIKRAEKYGIPKENILVDTLTMTVSTGKDNGIVTLEALEKVKKSLGVKTVLGASNISFGLPARENLTAAFLTLAIYKGLSGAIINPCSREIMNGFISACALSGLDDSCQDYIEYFKGLAGKEASKPSKEEPQVKDNSLGFAIFKGLKDSAESITLELLKTKEPLNIVNEDIIPALNNVGTAFEKGTLYLPQLLISADAAKESFEVIKEHLSRKGSSQKTRGKIILATVKGDVHDIGKNIVKVLLENYGYEILDLGKDVLPETIATAASTGDFKLVGLSALMTTTVASMAETITLLKREAKDCKIMVGGAVLTENYAKSIGADYYSKDALGAVRYANSIFMQEDI